MKKAFITGITGQDGAWLAKLLIEKGYEVTGGVRRVSTPNLWRLKHLNILNQVHLVDFDLLDDGNIQRTIKNGQFDEIYNLAAQSFVGTSFEQPKLTTQINAMAVLDMLEAMRVFSPDSRFYQASTSEMFGKVAESPQSERTRFHPRSPYGVAKAYAHYLVQNYRESFGLHASCGILFNHESELRGSEFVTRKITEYVARFSLGTDDVLELGNLQAKRDWGYAPEYVEGMWRMVQQPEGGVYVLATGHTVTVEQFVDAAFVSIGKTIEWSGEGIHQKGYVDGQLVVKVNEKFYRPAEVDLLLGDSSKAKERLGWAVQTNYMKLADIMVQNDIVWHKTLKV